MRHRMLAALPFLLLAIQQIQWSSLAWGALPALTALLLVGAAGYAVAAVGAARGAWRSVAGGLGVVAATEAAFVGLPHLFVPAFPLAWRLFEVALVAGLAWLAVATWRAAAPPAVAARGGAFLALGYFAVAAALGLASGETLLVPGYALGVAGVALLLRVPSAAHASRANPAQDGAVP